MVSYPQPNNAIPNTEPSGHSHNSTATLSDQSTPQLISTQQTPQKAEAQEVPRRSWRGLSLRFKATTLAIAIGTLPVVGVGATAYYFANQSFTKEITQNKQAHADNLAAQVNAFMFERYGDIQVMSKLAIFANPNLRKITPLQEKQAYLNNIVTAYKVYDSIAVFDINGNVIAQSTGPALSNHSDREYFKRVLSTAQPVISNPEISGSTSQFIIHFAAPIKDTVTGKTIAVVRSRMPVASLENAIAHYSVNGDNYHLIDAYEKYFVASEKEHVGQDVQEDLAIFSQLHATKQPHAEIVFDEHTQNEQLSVYQPLEKIKGLPDLGWEVLLATDKAIVFKPQRELLLIMTIGTGVAALLVGIIAALLANRATRPVLAAATAVEKLGQGELDTRITVQGEDELGVLGSNINRMASQIQTLLAAQDETARQHQQLLIQEEIARQQTEHAEQQRAANEQFQQRALELLMEVEPISKGDLTIRASVTPDQIGTIADSYNFTVASLRKIVTQVQAAAKQVTATTSSSEVSVQELSKEALRQAQEITAALDRIQEMSNSIRAVAANAKQAEAVVQQATQTVEASDAAMNRTVQGIVALRETVAETSMKLQRLGESSQKISKVVNLIGTFAAQTNLLALKASIEAARAGEEGRGFAVLADEVRALARQSQAATAEIESLVAAIQTETNEVVAAMEAGTLQVVEGTLLVDETRQNLNKITATSVQIGALVEAIASSAVAQSQASLAVTETMSDMAAIAQHTSTTATTVSGSFQELLALATQLQASVGQFKVRSEEIGR